MDHVIGGRAHGILPGLEDKYHFGRRPNGIYIPRFRNHTEEGEGFIRGFGYQGRIYRASWRDGVSREGVGEDFKQAVRILAARLKMATTFHLLEMVFTKWVQRVWGAIPKRLC